MQNLLTATQMRDADVYTIKCSPISSLNLMERAAQEFVKIVNLPSKVAIISIFCGTGNNGGDGLAIARLLKKAGFKYVSVYLINFKSKQIDNYQTNLKKLPNVVKVIEITEPQQLKGLKTDVIIDAVLGSGLNKPLQDKYAELAKIINGLNKQVIAVDVPTGFNTEGQIPEKYNGIKADLVISFQRPKINFFFPESYQALKRFKVVDVGLDESFIERQKSDWKLTTDDDIEKLLKTRAKFTHKGTYGNALLIAGNNTTMGAALLAASACLHTGAGLTTVCLPQSGLIALNTVLPEVMALPRNEHLMIAAFKKFTAIAIGPGLGLEEENEQLLEKIISLKKPLIIDADALTILSKRKDLLDKLPSRSILTPHMKEFDRLFGEHNNWWNRLETAKKQAQERGLIIVLKNQYTFICLPSGEIHINPTGNPAMASGGMGDVLTGIIAALVAQSYSPAQASVLGVYLHGKAGDDLAQSKFVISASQLALQIPIIIKGLLK
jgi:NAD(P)H-hydrate epimerase